MPALHSNGGSHCFFLQFWPPGALAWFTEKSVVRGGVRRGGVFGASIVNHKNVVDNFSAFKHNLDQFVDCKMYIVMYYKFTVHKFHLKTDICQ